jgi:hypothetical protein
LGTSLNYGERLRSFSYRASYEEAKSYRAISLSSFTLKVLERLVDTCLINKPLEPNQHAYQKGKSTNSAIHKVVQFIEDGLGKELLTSKELLTAHHIIPSKILHQSMEYHLKSPIGWEKCLVAEF